MPPLIYFLLCLAIAIFGINRKFGFWGYLFGSLLLSPIIGFLLVVSSDPRKKPDIVEDNKNNKKNKNKKDNGTTTQAQT